MITTIPYAEMEWTCLRCGESWSVPVTDVSADEGPDLHLPGFIHTADCHVGTMTGKLWVRLQPYHHWHHCADGSLGVGAFIGFKRSDIIPDNKE